MLLFLVRLCFSASEFCLRPDERFGECYDPNRTIVKTISEFIQLLPRNDTNCLLEVVNDESTIDEINLTLFEDLRLRILTIEGHESSVLRMWGYDYQSISSDVQTIELKNIRIIPLDAKFVIHGLIVDNVQFTPTNPVALDANKVTGGLSILTNFTKTTIRRSNFYLKSDSDYPTRDLFITQINPQDPYADQLISPIHDIDIDVNDTMLTYTFTHIGIRMFVQSMGSKFGIMLTHDQPGVVVTVDSNCHELQTIAYMGVLVSNHAIFTVKRSEMFLNLGNQHDILALDNAIIRLIDNSWGMFLGIYGKDVRVEVAGEHNMLYSLNTLSPNASATFVSTVENPKSLPVFLRTYHIQIESPGSFISLSNESELLIFPDLMYVTKLRGSFYYNMTYYSDCAMVIDSGVDLRLKKMRGPARLYYEQRLKEKGPVIKVDDTVELERGSWFLTDGNPDVLTDEDIEAVLHEDYYFFCGENVNCSNVSIEYKAQGSIGFTDETAISKPFCKKVENLGMCSGFQFIDVFSHINIEICYYESDSSLCSGYNYTLNNENIGSLKDTCVFPGTHKLMIRMAEDMSNNVAFDFDDITKSEFKLRIEINSTDGTSKKVNVKFSETTPNVINRIRLDHTILKFESKTSTKDLKIEGLEWGDDVEFSPGIHDIFNVNSPYAIDIPFCSFGKSNLDDFADVRIASEEEYSIEYIDDGWILSTEKCGGMKYIVTDKSPNMYMWSGIYPTPFTVHVNMGRNVTRPKLMHYRHGNYGHEYHNQTTIFSFSAGMENYTGVPIVSSDGFNSTKTQVYGFYVPLLAPYATEFRVWQRRGLRSEVRVPYQQCHVDELLVTNSIDDEFSTSFDGINFTQRKAKLQGYNVNHKERLFSLKSFDSTPDCDLTFEAVRFAGDFVVSSGQHLTLDYVSFINTTITINIAADKPSHVIDHILNEELSSTVPDLVVLNIDCSQTNTDDLSLTILTSPIIDRWLSITTVDSITENWNSSLAVVDNSLELRLTRLHKHKNTTKMIIGITVGCISAIVIVVIPIILCRRRNHKTLNTVPLLTNT